MDRDRRGCHCSLAVSPSNQSQEVIADEPRYSASLPDELDLRPGMKIRVLRLYDDAWGTGQVLSGGDADEIGKQGAFPIVRSPPAFSGLRDISLTGRRCVFRRDRHSLQGRARQTPTRLCCSQIVYFSVEVLQ